jgi:hypothetical protein
MSSDDDRIVDIGEVDQGYLPAAVRDEIIWVGGALSATKPMTPKEMERFLSSGFDLRDRLVVLSKVLLPQLCSIIGRGLTLEEIALIVGASEAKVKHLLKDPEVLRSTGIRKEEVVHADFVKVLVPLGPGGPLVTCYPLVHASGLWSHELSHSIAASIKR